MPVSNLTAITVALPHESKAILPYLKIQARTRYQGALLYEGSLGSHSCVLLQTGIGEKRAEQGVDYLFRHYPVRRLWVTGYCGGLFPGIKNGDGILADKILWEKDGASLTVSGDWQEEVSEKMRAKNIPFHRGSLVQVEKPAMSPEAKKKLGEKYQALGVDMETFSVLKLARGRQNITSLALRFIVDPVDVDLADTEAFVDDAGHFQTVPFLKQAMRQPSIFLKLPGLEKMASQARRRLAKAVEVIFDL